MTTPRAIVETIEAIPPLSPAALDLIRMCHEQERNMEEIASVAEVDPALTVNILKVVNAPAYGLGKPVRSLARAVSYLGLETVAAIAFATSAPSVFDAPLEGYEAHQGELWRHSLHTAIATREIARHAREPLAVETAFTAGLIHDIGKAVIAGWFKDRTTELLQSVDAGDAAGFDNAEQQALGFDHCEVGEALAKHWQLPDVMQVTVRHHHRPTQCGASKWAPVVYATHLGDIVSMISGSGTGADALMYPLDKLYMDHFSITETQLETLIMKAAVEFRRIETDFMGGAAA